MGLTPKTHARFLYTRIKKRLTPILWMLNVDALDILVKEVATLYLEEMLSDNDYKTRNFLIKTKSEIKNVNQWMLKTSAKK
jgi:hypothetical protein